MSSSKVLTFILFWIFATRSTILLVFCAPTSQNSVNSPPVISISNNSLEAIGIANKINQFFQNENGASNIQEVKVMPLSGNGGGVLNGEINMFNQDKSVVKLNLNLNVEIYNGKPQRLTLPQGDLILMFIPNGKKATQDQIAEFMDATSSETNIARTQNGALFMSWANQGDYPPNAAESGNYSLYILICAGVNKFLVHHPIICNFLTYFESAKQSERFFFSSSANQTFKPYGTIRQFIFNFVQ